MMLWSETRKWAKDNGYTTSKEKEHYTWHKTDDTSICGTSASVSKLARDIFNNITDNRFITHQQNYRHNE